MCIRQYEGGGFCGMSPSFLELTRRLLISVVSLSDAGHYAVLRVVSAGDDFMLTLHCAPPNTRLAHHTYHQLPLIIRHPENSNFETDLSSCTL